jgi:excinuclease UvrABC ATPase subunit
MAIKDRFRLPSGKLPVANAGINNLQNVSVDIAIGVLTVVTGLSAPANARSSTTRFCANTLIY